LTPQEAILPDFGVFQNQKVFTVYLDMCATDDVTAPFWTLQYAVLQPAPDPVQRRVEPDSRSADAALRNAEAGPKLTPELAAICARKLIVISG
jgi:hypothetical protein